MPLEAMDSPRGADPILFYFDYISPNAYLAWTRVHEVAERQGRGVTPVPVLFAALLAAGGRPGPAEVRDMWRWMVRNILRKAALRGIPLKPPRTHPFKPLLALRVSSLPMPEAIAAGVFGVPAMRVGEELFWGHDDLEFMERFLEGRDPLPRGDLAAWEAVRPSARRRA